MLEVLKQAALFSAIATGFLLLYSIIILGKDSLKNKDNIRSKAYIKESFNKLLNTVLIFYPLFMFFFSAICFAVKEIKNL